MTSLLLTPFSSQIAVVRTLHTRAYALTSSAVSRTKEECIASQPLALNGYLAPFIHRHSCCNVDSTHSSQSSTPTTSITIPYIEGTSEAIKCVLSPLGIRTTFRPVNTLCQFLVRPKDPVPIQNRSGVINCVPCSGCPHAYIGQTSRTLAQ